MKIHFKKCKYEQRPTTLWSWSYGWMEFM